MAVSMQLRRGTAAAWTAANTVLLAGQEGYESDTGKRKVGDGTSAWTSLAYTDAAFVSVSPASQAVRMTVGPAAPASPGLNDLWLSTSWKDVVPPMTATGRHRLFPSYQEPTAWQDGTHWWIIMNNSHYASCPIASDPTVAANWTAPVALSINPGATGGGIHMGAIYDGGQCYVYWTNTPLTPPVGGSKIYVSTGPDPSNLTHNSTPILSFAQAAGGVMNPRVFHDTLASRWVMAFAVTLDAGTTFQAGYATASSPTGPFTAQAMALPTLAPIGGNLNGCVDGPQVKVEGSEYVGWYHSSMALGFDGIPSDIWRAKSTDFVTWTILDNGNPVLPRAGFQDASQVADVCLVDSPSGAVTYAFYTAMPALIPSMVPGCVMVCALSPVLKRWDGAAWRKLYAEAPGAILPGGSTSVPSGVYLPGIGGNETYGNGAGGSLTPNGQATQGLYNTAFGTRALGTNSTGTYNTAVGYNALEVSTGAQNTAVGSQAMMATTTGTQNVAAGYNALLVNTTGAANTALGSQALQANTTANNNVAVGSQALTANTTGAANTAVGTQALGTATTATGNTAVGYKALFANTTGAANTAVGYTTLAAVTTGTNNTGVGYGALPALTTGIFNAALGQVAGTTVTTGSYNTFAGYNSAGSAAATGSATGIGSFTTVATNATALGCKATASGAGSVAIGHDNADVGASATGTNYFVLGTASHKVFVPGLPTADPHVVGQLWAAAGIVTVSAG